MIAQIEEQGGEQSGQSWNLGAYAQLGLKTAQFAYVCREMDLPDDAAEQIIGTYKARAEEKMNTLNNLMDTLKKYVPVAMGKLYDMIKENDPEAYQRYKERAAGREKEPDTIELYREAGNALFDIFSGLDVSGKDRFQHSFERAVAGFGDFFPEDMADVWKPQQDALIKKFMEFHG